MCGIVGYVGPRNSVDLVYEGLRRLEYRGYDSAGIAVLSDQRIYMEKASGKLANLAPNLKNLPGSATLALGHTRWATHGAPTKANAHPHAAEQVSLIHNGIIENYAEIKEELLLQGVQFRSDTDSEVVAHLISQSLKANRRAPVEKTLASVWKKLKGAYALGIILEDQPDAMYIVKNGAPLAVGIGQGEIFFASDAAAFVGEVQQAIFLEDQEWGKVTRTGFEMYSLEGDKIDRPHKVVTLDWSRASVEKQGYRHFMLKEIHEQPVIISETIQRFLDQSTLSFNEAELGLAQLDLDKIESIHIVACGTAYIAGLMGQYFLEPLLNMPIRVELASEFRYRKPHLTDKQLVISISQSGETADTLASVQHSKSFGCQRLSICNNHHAAIPRASDALLYMDAGQEVGVASTKAFTSQILCLYLFGLALAEKCGHLSKDELQSILHELRTLPLHMDTVINNKGQIDQLAKKYYEKTNFLYIGRGLNYPLAMGGALKLKEISYIHAEAYSAGELKHGPIALIDRHMPVLAIAPKDSYYEKTLSNIEEIRAREGKVIGIGNSGDERLANLCSDYIAVPHLKTQVFQAILGAIPVQLFAYYVAVHRGTDVDQPRNLAKSVTVK